MGLIQIYAFVTCSSTVRQPTKSIFQICPKLHIQNTIISSFLQYFFDRLSRLSFGHAFYQKNALNSTFQLR